MFLQNSTQFGRNNIHLIIHSTLKCWIVFDALVLKDAKKNTNFAFRKPKLFLSSTRLSSNPPFCHLLSFFQQVTLPFTQRLEDLKLEGPLITASFTKRICTCQVRSKEKTLPLQAKEACLSVFLLVSYPAFTKTQIVPFSLDSFQSLLLSVFPFLSACKYCKASLCSRLLFSHCVVFLFPHYGHSFSTYLLSVRYIYSLSIKR